MRQWMMRWEFALYHNYMALEEEKKNENKTKIMHKNVVELLCVQFTVS